MVGILVFQGGDWDNVYAVGALVGGVMRDFEFSTREISTFQPVRFRVFITRDFVFAIKTDFISVCHEKGDCIPAEWEMIGKHRRDVMTGGCFILFSACYICIFTGLLFQYKYNYCNNSAYQQQCTYRYSYYQHKRSFIFNE